MFTPTTKVTSLLASVLLIVTAFANEAVAKQRIELSDAGFATPESVEYYAAEDVYLVTNINGSPFAADDNGFISKVRPDGKVLALKWIDGASKDVTLHAPKGAAIVGKKLYVADRNQVHVFSLPSGKQLSSITLKESMFLNGITPGKGDSVYVTDSGLAEGFKPSGSDAIYQVWGNGKYKTVIKDKNMERPNGIWVQGDDLIIVAFGSNALYRVTMAGKRHDNLHAPKGSLDGLIRLNDGRLLFTSWESGSLYALSNNGKFSLVADKLDAPADIGFDTKRNRVLVPLFKQNSIIMLDI